MSLENDPSAINPSDIPGERKVEKIDFEADILPHLSDAEKQKYYEEERRRQEVLREKEREEKNEERDRAIVEKYATIDAERRIRLGILPTDAQPASPESSSQNLHPPRNAKKLSPETLKAVEQFDKTQRPSFFVRLLGRLRRL